MQSCARIPAPELEPPGLELFFLIVVSDPVLMLCRKSRTQQPSDNRAEPGATRQRLTFSPNQSAPRARRQTPIRASLSELPKNSLVNLRALRPDRGLIGSVCFDGRAPHPVRAEPVTGHVSGCRRVLEVGPMKGRGRAPAPASGREGRGRSVLMRGGAGMSAATNQRTGVGWSPNGGRGGTVAPPL